MALPLFDEPPAVVERFGIDSPEYAAWWTGFRQGAAGQGQSYRYDPDDRVNAYYENGHECGRLFRPLANPERTAASDRPLSRGARRRFRQAVVKESGR